MFLIPFRIPPPQNPCVLSSFWYWRNKKHSRARTYSKSKSPLVEGGFYFSDLMVCVGLITGTEPCLLILERFFLHLYGILPLSDSK